MEAKDIKKAIKKHGAERNVSYDDKYFTHNMPEFMCIAEISFKAGRRDTLDLLRKTNVGAWEELLIYIGSGGAKE